MREIFKGEKRNIGVEVFAANNEEFIIESATYRIVDENYEEIVDGVADIDENAVFFIFDSTPDDYVSGKSYYAYFSIIIAGVGKIIKGKVEIRLVR